jgi:hypothetical protein|eukprot:COSAG01_NODE_11975_length_1824_cov_2.243478_3_plen_84_part_00
MKAFMAGLRGRVTIGVVGGSDLVKIREQLGEEGAAAGAVQQLLLPPAPRLTRSCTPHTPRGALSYQRVRLRLRTERAGSVQGW